MTLTTPTSIVPLGGWVRGLNREVFELQLQPDESPDLENLVIGLRGEVERRDGFARWDSGTDDVGQRLIAYTPGSGTDKVVVVQENGEIWDGTTSTLTDTTNTFGTHTNRRNWQIADAMLDDQLYIFSLRADTWRWDNSSWTQITDKTLDESGTAASPEAPRAACATAHNNRVFVGNVNANGALSRSRIMWSNTTVENSGDAGGNRWSATAFIDVDEDDGTEVTQILSFQSNLLIFKDHSIHQLSGVDADSFTLYRVTDDVGCSSPQTVAQNEGDVFFFDRFKGVFVFDGVTATRIDGAIHSYLLSGQNLNRAWRAHGFFSDSRYFLSVPWGSDNFNSRTFVFDVRTGAWTEYDYGIYDHEWWSEKEYTVGNATEAGSAAITGVFKHEQGDTQDNGVDIDWYLETIWFPPAAAQGMTRYRMRRVDLWVEADSSTATVVMYVDGVETPVWTQSITASTNRIKLPAYGALWETCKFKISGT